MVARTDRAGGTGRAARESAGNRSDGRVEQGLAECNGRHRCVREQRCAGERSVCERVERAAARGVARVSGVEWRWEGTTPGAARPEGRIPGWKCLAGYCFAVRKDWLAERGGFDERMRVYWSDTDLQWEARRVAGESALTRTETGHVLGHMGHRTARGLADRREVWKRDRDVFVKKWSGAR